jgi:copper(I)-binding protein
MLPRRPAALAAILAALGLPFAAASAFAHDYTHGPIKIVHPWTRATPPSARAGGGYVTLVNQGTAADRLVSARSAAAGKVELHEMKMDGTVMRMRELEKGIELPAGATVTLMPGGLHVMFMELKAPFVKDGRVPVTLVFEKAGPIDVEFMIEAMGTSQPAHRH